MKTKKKTDYLAFCDNCGKENKLSVYIIQKYDRFYCKKCHSIHMIPNHIKKIADDL